MNFKQCVADICELIEQVGRGALSVEGAKLTAIGTIAKYSDSRYERLAKKLTEPDTAKTA